MSGSVWGLPGLTSVISVVISLVACGNGVAPTGQHQPQPATEVWTTFRGDLQRDGHPSTATLDASGSARLKLAWRANMGAAVDGSPAVSNGLVVVASQGGRIAAYGSASGSSLGSPGAAVRRREPERREAQRVGRA